MPGPALVAQAQVSVLQHAPLISEKSMEGALAAFLSRIVSWVSDRPCVHGEHGQQLLQCTEQHVSAQA